MPKTLLLADDSVTIQRVIELSFAHEDVRVVSVGDGRRAVEWLETESPDVVLVDVEVPEVDGYALTTHIKQSPRLKHVPVLLLAGAFEPVDDARAQSVGCDGVLVKPFEPQQLVKRVKELIVSPSGNGAGRDGAARRTSTSEADLSTVTPFRTPAGARTPEPELALADSPFRATVHGDFELGDEPQPLEPPTRPVWEHAPIGGTPAVSQRAEAAPAPPKVSLVNAFSALLAAEQSSQPAAPAPAAAAAPPAEISEASVEAAVRRVLVRMTDDLVRRIVIETAERMIREEIEKIKASPE